MTVEQLYLTLHSLLLSGKTSPETQIHFRHNIHENTSNFSSVDYVLTEVKPGSLVMCYDDGHW